MRFSRRRFLRTSAFASAALMGSGAMDATLARIARGATGLSPGYGPLQPDPERMLDLPPGFQYRRFSCSTWSDGREPEFQQQLTNGDPVPCRHDGMGAFAGPNGLTILVRNHEVNPEHTGAGVDPARTNPYDPKGRGGTTTLWVDRERNLVRSFSSLSGTFRNCAGGITPWGTWLTCEECTYLPGEPSETNADLHPGVSKRHGYVFEVEAHATEPSAPVPILAMGRFYHEAVGVDPATGFVYLSEDRKDGLLYRYRPDVVTRGGRKPHELAHGDLAKGGVLEALRVIGRPSVKTQNYEPGETPFVPQRTHKVDWLPIPVAGLDPDMDMERDPTDTAKAPTERRGRTAASAIRAQGFGLGCAQFARVEGVTYHQGALYFCATDGGPRGAGQVWKLDLRKDELSLVVQPDDFAMLDGPDNLVVAPNGDLIVCEDGRDDDYVVGVTPHGALYHLAHNAHNDQEFAGACFAPDGHTLFVNVQEPGLTYAVWGPWGKRRV